jgi:glutaredoxin
MQIKAYTLNGCSSCVQLKELFKRAELEYEEIVIFQDIQLEDFQQVYGNISYFPYVVIDDEPVGGLIEVAKRFVKEGLVSSKKTE